MSGQTVSKMFVPLSGGATAVYAGTSLSYYRHPDWLGSSRVATTTARAVYYDGEYSPYGESYNETGTTDRNFTGQNQDLGAVQYYDFLYREHNVIEGRWISPDPAGLAAVDPTVPQTWNRYAYVMNSPLTLVDLDGLNPFACDLWIQYGTEDGAPTGGMCIRYWRGGGGGGGGGGSGVPPVASQARPCATPNFLQQIEIKVMTKVANKLGKTVGIGVGGSAAAQLSSRFLGIYGTASAQLTVSPGGTANLVYSYGGTLLNGGNFPLGNPFTFVAGTGGLFGLQVSVSNSPPADNSYSLNGSLGVAKGYGGGVDASVALDGNFPTNPDWTVTGTGGFGFGGFGGAGAVVKTAVVPLCRE